MKNVLFLASWYPNRLDSFDGDFIERHAKAASLYNRIFVIYIVKDKNLGRGKFEIERKKDGNLHTYIGYYGNSNLNYGWFEKALSVKKGFSIYKTILNEIISGFGIPEIIHLNVLMNAGIYALWTHQKYKIPIVLTEHWTGYFKGKQGFEGKPWPFRYWANKVYNSCELLLPVSHDLGKKMNEVFSPKKFKVIANVVNTKVVFPSHFAQRNKTRLFHASTMVYNKNIEGLLRVIHELSKQRNDFELHIAGTPPEEITQWAQTNGLLNRTVFFIGLIPYQEIAENLRKSDALIMFSRFENLPCIILEALCSGLPVVTTNVGGIAEVINDTNGLLVENENEVQLLNAVNLLLDSFEKFDRKQIAVDAASKFSYETVGKEFDLIYQKVGN